VFDDGRLTDNKGNMVDFKNVIIIMTSNVGARDVTEKVGKIGFGHHDEEADDKEIILKSVKKQFKPEFINRLSGTVVFNDMDRTMATLILRKKLGELQEKLTAKKVEMTLTDEAFDYLLKEGFTKEYGAREMDRVITGKLKPMLMKEILFGSLKKGGKIEITLKELGQK
jgi:ATP-dependent Clp protease ATP-binding subunit ClpA